MRSRQRSRRGITPVVAMVLLLMMTVAAAGGAYAWFSQMQDKLQDRARSDLQQQLSVKDVQCDAAADTVTLALKNAGKTDLDVSEADVFIRGSGGHLNSTVTDRDWTGLGFETAGGFGEATVDLANAASGSDFLVAGTFYKIEVAFPNADYSLSAGGCLAES